MTEKCIRDAEQNIRDIEQIQKDIYKLYEIYKDPETSEAQKLHIEKFYKIADKKIDKMLSILNKKL